MGDPGASGGWVVLIPQKDSRRAKSRIALPAARRQELVLAMLRDTVSATLACRPVERVVLVVDREEDTALCRGTGVDVHRPVGADGLNAAIRSAEAWARRACHASHVAVVPSDLPALDPRDLELGLLRAAHQRRSFVRDLEGTGTTMLTAADGSTLLPAYGRASAASHERSGATDLGTGRGGLGTLSADVDNLHDLLGATRLGLGDRSTRLLEDLTDVPELAAQFEAIS